MLHPFQNRLPGGLAFVRGCEFAQALMHYIQGNKKIGKGLLAGHKILAQVLQSLKDGLAHLLFRDTLIKSGLYDFMHLISVVLTHGFLYILYNSVLCFHVHFLIRKVLPL